MAARGAAEAATSQGPESDAQVTHVRDLVSRTSHRIPRPDKRDPHIQAHLATAEAETFRAEDRAHIDQWARAAAAWDVLGRPHDAAYCRWRGAQAAFREGQGTLAIRLLNRAKTDARHHVPLSSAIATTSAAG
jgi:hypothetical protein